MFFQQHPCWATPDSPIHNPLHGYNYETWVIARLKLTLSNEEFERSLKGLKIALKTDAWDKKILEPRMLTGAVYDKSL